MRTVSYNEIVIVTICLGNDGAERVLTELANEWEKMGCKLTIVQTGANNYSCNYPIDKQIEIYNIEEKAKSKLLRYYKQIKQLIAFLNRKPNAIALAFVAAPIFQLSIASLFVKNKVIVSERNNPSKCPSYWFARQMRNLAFFLADKCVFQTPDAMNYFPNFVQNKGTIICNPINPNLPLPFTSMRSKTIVTACRLHPQKNLFMLIDAFAMFVQDYPDYNLIIYGQGELKQNIEEYVQRIKLTHKIDLPGFCEHIHDKICSSAMYVSSSDYEGISNSMLEALAMGVPTIVTDCPMGGARMCIQNNINGILIPVGDTNALYKAMKKIVEDIVFRKKISENASLIRKRFPIDVVAKQWLDFFNEE